MIYMKENDNKIKISKTDKTKGYWLNQDFISEDLKSKLENDNVLFVPEFWKDEKTIGFYEGVHPFYEFIEEQEIDNLKIGICIEEEDYRELHLHADVLWMGMVIIECFVLPLFINLLSNYIDSHYFHDSDDKIDIKLNIQKKNEENILLEYHGGCDDFIKLINDDNFNELIKNPEE